MLASEIWRKKGARQRSYEVCFPDGRESVYFYWDDNPGRASITHRMSSTEAARQAKALAKTEQEKLERESPT